MASTFEAPLTCSGCLTRLVLNEDTVCICRFPIPAYDLVQFRCVQEGCQIFVNVFVISIAPADVSYLELIGTRQDCKIVPPIVEKQFAELFGFVPDRPDSLTALDEAAFYSWMDSP